MPVATEQQLIHYHTCMAACARQFLPCYTYVVHLMTVLHAGDNVQLLFCACCTGITQLFSTVLTSPVSLDDTHTVMK